MALKFVNVVVTGALLAGCASNSGVAPNGQDTLVVSRQAASGFSGTGNLKAEALTEANQYCANQKKSLSVVDIREAQPPFVMGNFPKAEILFACFDASKIDGVMAECNEKRLRKEIRGFKASVECSSSRVKTEWRERKYPHMDLVDVYEAARLVGAENVDKGRITEAEYQLQMAELRSRFTAESQKRNLAVTNSQAAQAHAQAANTQANAAMLAGLSAFQMANRPLQPAQNVNVTVCNLGGLQADTCSYR